MTQIFRIFHKTSKILWHNRFTRILVYKVTNNIHSIQFKSKVHELNPIRLYPLISSSHIDTIKWKSDSVTTIINDKQLIGRTLSSLKTSSLLTATRTFHSINCQLRLVIHHHSLQTCGLCIEQFFRD